MTIPSIRGDGSAKFNVNIKSNSSSALNQNSAPETLSGNNEVSSIDSDNKLDSKGKDETQTTVVNDDEYSIKQFRKDYQIRLEKDVMPILAAYESERKKRYMWAVISAVVFSIAAVFILFNFEGRSAGDFAGICVTCAFGIWFWIKKSFENKIKRLIMPTLMKAMHGFTWQQTPAVTAENIASARIFPKSDVASKEFDDCFVGEYRKVPIAISECTYSVSSGKNKRTLFKGAVIRIKMNKNFDGVTVVRPKHVGINDVSDLKKFKMEEVKLEDVEFGKDYTIYSTDQIEARYLLTTAFMDRFKEITMAFCSMYSFCAFYGEYVYIAPYCSSDLFNLCSLMKPVTNKEQFEQLFNEFVSILQLVDHFKLDKRLGL